MSIDLIVAVTAGHAIIVFAAIEIVVAFAARELVVTGGAEDHVIGVGVVEVVTILGADDRSVRGSDHELAHDCRIERQHRAGLVAKSAAVYSGMPQVVTMSCPVAGSMVQSDQPKSWVTK